MKFLQTLLEAPLPDDWDKDIFKSRTPFSKQLKYALERAKEVGRGSARVAFEIPYQGRKTVLKIALNRKGLAQNEEEVRILADKNIQKLGLTIPMIDFDEENTQPKWIHVEYGEEVTDSKLEQYFSIPFEEIAEMVYQYERDERIGSTKNLNNLIRELTKYYGEAKVKTARGWFDKLLQLCQDTGLDVRDMVRTHHQMREYNGKVVLVDLGGTKNVTQKYYDLSNSF